MTGTEKDLENLASAVRNSKQPTTMTFNEIEKEIDEELPKMISDLVWCVSDGGYKIESHRFLSYQDEPVQEYENIKSFLKQSFIKYLKDEVEFIERKKYTTLGTSGEWCKSENTPNGLAQHFTDEFTAKWHNCILDDQITHLQAQIKELEV